MRNTGLAAAMVMALAGAALAQDAGEIISKQYDDGSVYEGTFVNGLQDGKGTYRLPSGYEYSGEWVGGEIRGT
ncbi:MAG: 2-isopropylmalate synthase, partial [Cypionkella sp.]|nr:2-isopropylmalate synthase [Cypionkella sp.]